jgi:hypothetical protein
MSRFEGGASEMGGSALGELCTRDHLPIPTVIMLRSAHLPG